MLIVFKFSNIFFVILSCLCIQDICAIFNRQVIALKSVVLW